MGSEKFCLRWNDFESNISSAFRELRDDKDFFDITLACDDEQIQAHKVILSACSPFFRNILRRNPHQHPLLYLKGVKYTDLQSVLNFMYHGEVNVAQDELNSFLAVAEDLRVKGLTQNQSQRENPSHESRKPSSKPSQHIKSTPRPPDRENIPTMKRPRPPSYTIDNDDIQEIVPVKSEPSDPIPTPIIQHQPAPVIMPPPAPVDLYSPQPVSQADQTMAMTYQEENYEDYTQYGEEYNDSVGMDTENKGDIQDMLAEAVTEDGKTAWRCLVCGKDFLDKSNARRHIRTMHYEAPMFECEICGKVLKNKNSYQNHISITHGIKRRAANKIKL